MTEEVKRQLRKLIDQINNAAFDRGMFLALHHTELIPEHYNHYELAVGRIREIDQEINTLLAEA